MAGLTRYQVKPGSSFVCGTQPDRNSFISECKFIELTRPDCKKPVLHFSLSLPACDRLDDNKWTEATTLFLYQMGLADHSFFCVRHSDTDHDHVHVAVCKISANGQIWDTQKSAIRAMSACEKIEEKMGLTKTQTLADFQQKTGHRRNIIQDGSTQEFRRTGKVKSDVQLAIQKRKSKEKEDEQNRNAHRKPAQDNGRLDECTPPNPEKVQGSGRRNFDIKNGNPSSQITNSTPEKIADIETKTLTGDPHYDHPKPARPLSSNRMQRLSQLGLATSQGRPKPADILPTSSQSDRYGHRGMHRQTPTRENIGIGRILSFATGQNEIIFTKNNRRLAKLAEDRNSIIVFELDREAIDFAIGHAVKSGLVPLSIFGTQDFILAAEQRADALGIEIKNRVSVSRLPNPSSSKNQWVTTKQEGLKTEMNTPPTSLDRLKIELNKIDLAVKNGNIKSAETAWRYPIKIKEWINSELKLDPTAHYSNLLEEAGKDNRIDQEMIAQIGIDLTDSQNDDKDEAAQSYQKMRM